MTKEEQEQLIRVRIIPQLNTLANNLWDNGNPIQGRKLDSIIDELTNVMQQELNRLQRYDEELTKVMNPDFKDWHQNSKECHPEIAAWVITNLREQLDWAHKEIDRLYAKDTSQTGT
jgi:hypothetical protein